MLWFEDRVFDIHKISDKRVRYTWETFIASEQLHEEQINQFEQYLSLLLEWNKIINLTAITDIAAIIKYHFQDSLQAAKEIDFTTIRSIVDVGSGAGLPGIPLKIRYPHLFVLLIEVNRKKIAFLHAVIEALKMKSIEIYSLDWRTFLRKTAYNIDIVCARASLKPEELIRMFKPSSPYKNATLLYWASEQWVSEKKEQPLVEKEILYTIGNKKRKLIFFS